MYKPQKHLRLESLNRLPKVDELEKAFEQAKGAKGCLVELPWRSSKTGKNYSLGVRVDLGQTDPVWTLFEGEGSSSHAIWSVPFQDVELLNDVLLLSLPKEFDNPAKTIQDQPAASGENSNAQSASFPTPTITRVTPVDSGQRTARPAGSTTGYKWPAADKPNTPSAPTTTMPAPPPAVPSPAPITATKGAAPAPTASGPRAAAPSTSAPGSGAATPATTAPGPRAATPATTAPGPRAATPATTAPGPRAATPATTAPGPKPAPAPPQMAVPSSMPSPLPPYQAPANQTPAGSYPPNYPPAYAPSYASPPPPPPPQYPQPQTYSYPADSNAPKPYAPYPQGGSNGPDTLQLASSVAVQSNMPPGAMLGIAPPSVPEVPTVEYEAPKRRTGIQLGKLLLEASFIPQHTLDAALLLQDMVKSGALEVTQAAEALARAHNRSGAFETKIFLAKPNPNARSLNISVPPLGQILIEAGLINTDALRSALKLQEETRTGAMSIDDAIGVFVRDSFGKIRPETNADQPEVERAINLLRYAGMLDPQDMEAAENIRKKHGGQLLNILLSAGKIDDVTLEAAIHCQYFVSQKRMKVEQAVILLHFCQRSRITLYEAIDELGLERP